MSLTVLADPLPSLDMLSLALELPSACRSFLMAKMSDEKLNACLPLSSVLPLASSEELPEPDEVSLAVKAICRVAPCEQNMVDTLRANMREKCASSIQSGSASGTFKAALHILDNYAPLRNASCIQSTSGGLCAIESYGRLYPKLKGAPQQQLLSKQTLEHVPKGDLCTDCNKGILTVLLEADRTKPGALLGEQDGKAAKESVSQVCGAEFLDGKTNTKPSQETMTSLASNTLRQDGAAKLLHALVAGAGLAATIVLY
ncbi:hypothetical protein THASP1DRAFT_30064 [Thamnocephalis sphaerospora]|uniref:DUF7729 domain-containing protein n=1 Tax=Thamnocephalis sphaerospora TaxID=78915 RepID=A0A4V1IWN0_9FUNG|nr:hypothetical protein THASP1DRAFT_30064 [Thamnocephalis sphaerospora]|eukprot:RKP08129.1 hypothetical protein THASP1DRAFT_30064 [Thamnocephalis sphaerospora]